MRPRLEIAESLERGGPHPRDRPSPEPPHESRRDLPGLHPPRTRDGLASRERELRVVRQGEVPPLGNPTHHVADGAAEEAAEDGVGGGHGVVAPAPGDGDIHSRALEGHNSTNLTPVVSLFEDERRTPWLIAK